MSTSEITAKMDEIHFQIRSLQKIRGPVDVVGDTDVANSVAGGDPVLQPVIEEPQALAEAGDDIETALQMFTLRTVESLKGEVVAICDDNLELLKKICLDSEFWSIFFEPF